MGNRLKCIVDGCNNLASRVGYKKDGSPRYRKLCMPHHSKKYSMPVNGHARILRGFPNKECSICGWKGPCDRHRIRYGMNGGDYIKGNVIVLCSNCHRLLHLGLLSIK